MDRPIRIAIVGSGPSGFYAAGHLLKQAPVPVEVDVIERLPTPWGLVRGGVAPDHPKIKSVTRVYEKTAAHPAFRFFGNVEVGRDVRHEELLEWYDAVLYAVGTSTDRRAGVPGEDLAGVWSATSFVGWYNGHPDYRDLEIDLTAERAVVIGNGNVAIDVARMLVLDRSELEVTDIADHALEALEKSAIKEIVILGRRGPQQAAFTNPELLELGELADADVIVDPRELQIEEEVMDPSADATALKNVEILHQYSQRPPAGHHKRIVLRFLSSPVEILGDDEGRVTGVRVTRNRLEHGEDGRLRAVATDEQEVIEAQAVFRAIGYTGVPLPGVPFDERRGLIANEGGRIVEDGAPVPGAYVAGWIKRGPSGVIGTNKKCAQETVDLMLEDLAAGRLRTEGTVGSEEVEERLAERQPKLVDYAGWQMIDSHEKALGEPLGRPRVKLTRIDEMLEIVSGASAPS